jgi:hypothetical protein
MSNTYTTSSSFLFITYSWIAHQHTFPNAKLYVVPDKSIDAADRITFSYCLQCEAALQQWQKSDA